MANASFLVSLPHSIQNLQSISFPMNNLLILFLIIFTGFIQFSSCRLIDDRSSHPIEPLPSNLSSSEVSTVRIHVIDGFIPHEDALSLGDIQVKILINNYLIGETKKIFNSYLPVFNQFFVTNVHGHDVIGFEIWDIDVRYHDLEGTFNTSCNRVIENQLNNTRYYYKPKCQTSKNCWLVVTITCFP